MPVGPFIGKAAIAAAYREQAPDDVISVSNARVVDGTLVTDYRWSRQPGVARSGEMRLSTSDGHITRLVVTFDT